MDTAAIITFFCIAAALSLLAHWRIKRFWLAVVVGATSASAFNLLHELMIAPAEIRPSDAAFWLPMIFGLGMAFALPISVVLGLPFAMKRRRQLINAV